MPTLPGPKGRKIACIVERSIVVGYVACCLLNPCSAIRRLLVADSRETTLTFHWNHKKPTTRKDSTFRIPSIKGSSSAILILCPCVVVFGVLAWTSLNYLCCVICGCWFREAAPDVIGNPWGIPSFVRGRRPPRHTSLSPLDRSQPGLTAKGSLLTCGDCLDLKLLLTLKLKSTF